jgi:hypothetical protein
MKPENQSPRHMSPAKIGRSRSGHSPLRIPQIPIEWMDPMSWRLPSGKALAEFALQAGFLAPLMLGTPRFKRKRETVQGVAPVVLDKHVEEAPDRSGSFREIR